MRKTIVQGMGWLLLFLGSTSLKAQTPVYFFYDPACIQQLDYERVNSIDDVAHTDYYTTVAPEKQLIFSVQKNAANLNKQLVAEIPVKPYMCADRGSISPALMKEINSNRRMAYMVVQMGEQYALYTIFSVSTLENTAKGLVYTDPIYGFNYEAAVSKPGEILNHQKNKERNVFFEAKTNTACLATYEFKIISRHIETPIKHLTFVDKIGFQRLHTTQGELRLTHVNGQPVAEKMAQLCNESVAPLAMDVTQKAGAVKSTGLPDTAGLSPVEKRLWLSRQAKGLTARNIVEQPVNSPVGNQGLPPGQGVPVGMIDVPINEDRIPLNSAPIATDPPRLLPGGIYIVQEKESLYTISEKFNISVERLVTLNNLQGFELGLNQPLKVVDDSSIPKQSLNPLVEMTDNGTTKTTIHVVEQGDTLYGISKRYGITLKDVYMLNPSLTTDEIDINQRIKVGYQPI
ncbi:MAG: LysM peptidoglycan-binding domain-containing protein [Aureispira sp.]